MKIEELSVGDYLQNTNSNIGKVIGFTEQGEVIMRYAENSTCFSELSMLRPIEITPEILEKNGFDIQDNGIYLNTKSDFYEIDAKEVLDGYWRIRVTSCEIINEQDEIHTSYVHSLQNFLTLCGVKLEIKL